MVAVPCPSFSVAFRWVERLVGDANTGRASLGQGKYLSGAWKSTARAGKTHRSACRRVGMQGMYSATPICRKTRRSSIHEYCIFIRISVVTLVAFMGA